MKPLRRTEAERSIFRRAGMKSTAVEPESSTSRPRLSATIERGRYNARHVDRGETHRTYRSLHLDRHGRRLVAGHALLA